MYFSLLSSFMSNCLFQCPHSPLHIGAPAVASRSSICNGADVLCAESVLPPIDTFTFRHGGHMRGDHSIKNSKNICNHHLFFTTHQTLFRVVYLRHLFQLSTVPCRKNVNTLCLNALLFPPIIVSSDHFDNQFGPGGRGRSGRESVQSATVVCPFGTL
jgi:hypothetical protein